MRQIRGIQYFVVIAVMAVGFIAAAGQAVQAAEVGPFRTTFLGKAAEGYDVVAYFTEKKAVEGKNEFSHKWNGATWVFSSAANRDAFAKMPEKYAPQYGGYCAYAVSQGYTASVDPEAWSVVDGKLYLNYSKAVRDTWNKDIPGYIQSGDKYWPKIRTTL